MNSQGYGQATASVPTSIAPYQSASGPTNVFLRATSDSMLTVSFSLPEDNGGDAIKSYRVEWDTTPKFNSIQSVPNKGFIDLDASSFSSYTITYLTEGQTYYVRVFAINAAGLSTPTLSSPSSLAPSLQVPGKPHTLSATTGSVSGSISLSWQRPRIPWHNIPCSGLINKPNDCPSGVAGGLSSSDGGSTITEYQISYNDQEDFSGYDNGQLTTTLTSYSLTNLTPDRKYYLRVLARNAQGAGGYCAYTESNCLVVFTVASATAKALSTAT
eukprot:gene12331-16540_t